MVHVWEGWGCDAHRGYSSPGVSQLVKRALHSGQCGVFGLLLFFADVRLEGLDEVNAAASDVDGVVKRRWRRVAKGRELERVKQARRVKR
jgi:hypothetical protein